MPPAPTPLAERFWAKVDKQGPLHPDLQTRCWLWTGARSRSRGLTAYGHIREGGRGTRMWRVNRLAIVLATGEDAPGMDACHRCDNPLCCNPDHLFWGTHRYNMLDYIRKYGRVAVEKRPLPPRPALPFEEPLDEIEAAVQNVLRAAGG